MGNALSVPFIVSCVYVMLSGRLFNLFSVRSSVSDSSDITYLLERYFTFVKFSFLFTKPSFAFIRLGMLWWV